MLLPQLRTWTEEPRERRGWLHWSVRGRRLEGRWWDAAVKEANITLVGVFSREVAVPVPAHETGKDLHGHARTSQVLCFAPSTPCTDNSCWSRAWGEALVCARTCPALLGEGEPCRNYLNLVWWLPENRHVPVVFLCGRSGIEPCAECVAHCKGDSVLPCADNAGCSQAAKQFFYLLSSETKQKP